MFFLLVSFGGGDLEMIFIPGISTHFSADLSFLYFTERPGFCRSHVKTGSAVVLWNYAYFLSCFIFLKFVLTLTFWSGCWCLMRFHKFPVVLVVKYCMQCKQTCHLLVLYSAAVSVFEFVCCFISVKIVSYLHSLCGGFWSCYSEFVVTYW